jgi:hypothetical protein
VAGETAWSEWLSKMDEAASHVPSEVTGSLSIGLEVEGGGPSWRVRMQEGRVRVLPGEGGSADVVLRTDPVTAEQLANGELDVITALSEGRIRVGGQTQLLGSQYELIAQAQEKLAAQQPQRLRRQQ